MLGIFGLDSFRSFLDFNKFCGDHLANQNSRRGTIRRSVIQKHLYLKFCVHASATYNTHQSACGGCCHSRIHAGPLVALAGDSSRTTQSVELLRPRKRNTQHTPKHTRRMLPRAHPRRSIGGPRARRFTPYGGQRETLQVAFPLLPHIQVKLKSISSTPVHWWPSSRRLQKKKT